MSIKKFPSSSVICCHVISLLRSCSSPDLPVFQNDCLLAHTFAWLQNKATGSSNRYIVMGPQHRLACVHIPILQAAWVPQAVDWHNRTCPYSLRLSQALLAVSDCCYFSGCCVMCQQLLDFLFFFFSHCFWNKNIHRQAEAFGMQHGQLPKEEER